MFAYTEMSRLETRIMIVSGIPLDIFVGLASIIYFGHWFWVILVLSITQILYSFIYSKCYSYLIFKYGKKLRFVFYFFAVALQVVTGSIIYWLYIIS